MKQIIGILSLFAVCASLHAASATVKLDNYSTGTPSPIYIGTEGTLAADDAAGNIYIQILGGPVGGTLGLVANTLGETVFRLDPTFGAYGLFDAGVGVIPGVEGGLNAELKLTIWKDVAGSTFEAASAGLKPVYQSAPWSQLTASWPGNPTPPSTEPYLQIPAGAIVLNVVPEPSTLALGALGLVALFLRRRQ